MPGSKVRSVHFGAVDAFLIQKANVLLSEYPFITQGRPISVLGGEDWNSAKRQPNILVQVLASREIFLAGLIYIF